MPTTYAHWSFGQDCINIMPDELKKIANSNREIFDLGVHGPDIFFYELTNSDVAKYGDIIHANPARLFFESCKNVYRQHEEKEMMLSYILGFLSHFTLDSICHSYVERKKEVSGLSHNKIEAEWDAHCIKQDKREVNRAKRDDTLRPNRKIAEVLSYFYPYDAKQMYKVTRLHQFFISVLNYRSAFRYKFLHSLALKMNMNRYADLLYTDKEDESCKDSNMRLDKLRNKAKELFPVLLKNLMNFINFDEPLSDYFEHNFERQPDYKDIEVLSPEEEIEYTV